MGVPVCASVGCGRYKQGHAHRHFAETGQLYSLELETQRVWDYAGDGYVHRLIQNKADGKLVELSSASSATATPERSRTLPASASYASAMSTSGTKHSGPPVRFDARADTRQRPHSGEDQQQQDQYAQGDAVGARPEPLCRRETRSDRDGVLVPAHLSARIATPLLRGQAGPISITAHLSHGRAFHAHPQIQADRRALRANRPLERSNDLLSKEKERSDKKAGKTSS